MAQQDMALYVMAYLLLAAAIASLVAVVVFALRARPRQGAAPTATSATPEFGFVGVLAAAAAAVVGAVLGWRISRPNGD